MFLTQEIKELAHEFKLLRQDIQAIRFTLTQIENHLKQNK